MARSVASIGNIIEIPSHWELEWDVGQRQRVQIHVANNARAVVFDRHKH